jgi:Zn-dependent alcohol dehydrogenase
MTPEGVQVAFSGFLVPELGHSILGSNYGSSVPAVDFPRLARLYLAGKLPVDKLITRRIELGEVNDAFADMRARRGGRAVIAYA